jgi:hypothetical protein
MRFVLLADGSIADYSKNKYYEDNIREELPVSSNVIRAQCEYFLYLLLPTIPSM